MATVNVSFATQTLSIPASVIPSSVYKLQLMQGATVRAIVNVSHPATAGSFAAVADGTYTVLAQRTAAGGSVIGEATSAPFDVVNTVMADVDVPAVVNVTIG